MANKQSKQLAKVTAIEGIAIGEKRVVIHYDRLDEPKQGQKACNLKSGLKAIEAKLKALKVGDEVVIVKEETDDKKFWNLVDLEDASTFVKKEKPVYHSSSKPYQAKSAYDNQAPVRGMMFNNAIQISIKDGDTSDQAIRKQAKRLAELFLVVDEDLKLILSGKQVLGKAPEPIKEEFSKEVADDWGMDDPFEDIEL